MIERIAILGTGLLGTSVGLALRAAGYRGSIMGWNRSPEQGEGRALDGRDRLDCRDPLQAAQESQVVLLAVPIYATLDFMEQLSQAARAGSSRDRCWQHQGADHRRGRAPLQHCRSVRVFFPVIPWRAKSVAELRLADANLFRGAVWLFTDDPVVEALALFGSFGKGLARMGGCDGRAND